MATIKVYIRLAHDGFSAALTEDEIEHGSEFADNWGEAPFREFMISVEATPPKAADTDSPDASVTIPDETPPVITVAA